MKTKNLLLAAAMATALALVGCGGGNDGVVADAAAPSVPDSAASSVDAFVAFLTGLVTDDTSEPLAIGDTFVAPTTDTLEPNILG
jgi:ABC-type glycerol-3-phosphate transport system substrate-binding protein